MVQCSDALMMGTRTARLEPKVVTGGTARNIIARWPNRLKVCLSERHTEVGVRLMR